MRISCYFNRCHGIRFFLLFGLTSIAQSTFAANPNLFASAENSQFDNYFGGPMVVEVIVIDSDIDDIDEAKGEPDVFVNGEVLRMVQGINGWWYGYFADLTMAQRADSTVGHPGFGLDFGEFCRPDSDVAGIDLSRTDAFAIPRDIESGSNGLEPIGLCNSELDEESALINHVVREAQELSAPPRVGRGQIGLDETLWPLVQLYDFKPGQNVVIHYNKGGGFQVITLNFDTVDQFANLDHDRAKYPQNAHVHLSITDVMLNIDPTDEDSWTFGTNPSSPMLIYQAFDEHGRMDADGTAGAVNLNFGEMLHGLMFRRNGALLLDADAQNTGVDVVNLFDNDNQAILAGYNASATVSAGGTFSPGSQPVTITEQGPNAGIFSSTDDKGNSSLRVSAGALRGTSATVTYNETPFTILTAFASATVELLRTDEEWNSGEEIDVRLFDPDLNKNSLADEDLDLFNPNVGRIPTLQTGSPFTLKNLTRVELDGSQLIIQDIQPCSLRAMLMNPMDDGTLQEGSTLILTMKDTFADVYRSINDPAGPFSGFNFFNYDLRSFDENLDGRPTKAVDIHITDGQKITSFLNVDTQAFLNFDDAVGDSIFGMTHSAPVQIHVTFHVDEMKEIPQGTVFPLVCDFFSFGRLNDGILSSQRVSNQIIRFELEETGDNTSVFEGTLKYTLWNQLTIQDPRTYELRTINDEPTFVATEGLLGRNAPTVVYFDFDVNESINIIHDREELLPHSGAITLDTEVYKALDRVTVTLNDPDLNTNSDLFEIYTVVSPSLNPNDPARDSIGNPGLGFFQTKSLGAFGRLLEITINGRRWQSGLFENGGACGKPGNPHDGFADTGFVLIETEVDSGVFVGDFEIPRTFCNAETGLVESVVGGELAVNYTDFLNSTNELEIVRETVELSPFEGHSGFAVLDRPSYPIPFGSVADFFPGKSESNQAAPDGKAFFPLHHTAVTHDGDESVDANIEEIGPGDLMVHIAIDDTDFNGARSERSQIAIGDHGPVKIMIQRGDEVLLLATAGGEKPNSGIITAGADIVRGVTRELGPMAETSWGIYGMSIPIRYTDGPASSLCPETPDAGYSSLNGDPDVLGRFDQLPGEGSYCILTGDRVVVEYADSTNDIDQEAVTTTSSVFGMNDGRVVVNSDQVSPCETLQISLVDDDLNLDSRVVESYSLDLIEWQSDAATLTMGALGEAIAAFSPNPVQLLETGPNSGKFQAEIQIPFELQGNFLGFREPITLEYLDWSASTANYVGSQLFTSHKKVESFARLGNRNLFVSGENSQFENHFTGPMVMEVVVIDHDINDTDELKEEPLVTVNNRRLRMVQAVDGNWYGYFANLNAARKADETVALPGFGLDFGEFCEPGSLAAGGIDLSETDGFSIARDIDSASNGSEPLGLCTGTIEESDPLVNHVVRESKDINTEIAVPGQIGIDTNAWPLIQLYDFSPGGNVVVQYHKGSCPQNAFLVYDTSVQFAELTLDRETFPPDSNVDLTLTDLVLNVDPTDEDSWTFGTHRDSLMMVYQAFDEHGNRVADGTGGAVNIIDELGNIGFAIEGFIALDVDTQGSGVDVVNLVDNDDQQIIAGNRAADAVSIGGSFGPGTQPLTITEQGPNSGVFSSVDEEDRSNLKTTAEDGMGNSAVIEYNGTQATILTSFSDASIDIQLLDEEWNSGEEIPVVLFDPDANKNSRADEDLDIFNPEVEAIPALQMGNPITLENLEAAHLAGSELAIDEVQPFSQRAMLRVSSGDLSIPDGSTLVLTLGDTFADLYESINDPAGPFSGFNLLNFDIRSIGIAIGRRLMNVDITDGRNTLRLVVAENQDRKRNLQVLTDLSEAEGDDLFRMDVNAKVQLIFTFGGEESQVIPEGTVLPIVCDFFSYGKINDGTNPEERINNMIIRLELEETGDNTSTFAGSLEFTLLNQLNILDVDTYEGLSTIADDPAFIVTSGLFGEHAPKVVYLDRGTDSVFTEISDQQDVVARSGRVSFDAGSYKVGDTVLVILDDPDLNVDSDLLEIYTSVPPSLFPNDPASDTVGEPGLGNYIMNSLGAFGRLLEITFNGERWRSGATENGGVCGEAGVPDDGLGDATFSMVEISAEGGVFIGSFEIPDTFCNTSSGRIESITAGTRIGANYVDFLNGDSTVAEVSASANVVAHTGSVSFDRTVYPVPFGAASDFFPDDSQSDSVVPNGDSIFPIHHTGTIADGDGNIDVKTEEIGPRDLTVYIRVTDPDFDLRQGQEETIALGAHGPVKIVVRRGDNTMVLATAGGAVANDGVITVGLDIIPGVTRELGPIHEIAPDAGIFELDFPIRYTDGPETAIGPITPDDGYSSLNGESGVLGRFNQAPTEGDYAILAGDVLIVEYIDPLAAAGERNTVTDSSTFDLRTGRLQTDRSRYRIGDTIILTLTEPDFDLDNDNAELYTLDLLEWRSNATVLTMGDIGGGLQAFNPEPVTFRETGDSTGIFQATIKMPQELTGNRITRNDEIRLQYLDWAPTGNEFVGKSSESVNQFFSTSGFGATIKLDKTVYSWTDKVVITVVAPDWNVDSSAVGSIGGTEVNPVSIATRGSRLDRYMLVETGNDTGIFTGEVILTGFLHDADGDPSTGDDSGFDTNPRTAPLSGGGPDNGLIETDDNDKITVSFAFDTGEVATTEGLIRWNIGQVRWIDEPYASDGAGTVRVIDGDMNLDPLAIDSFVVIVSSDTDFAGILVQVSETDVASGIFEAEVHFTQSGFSEGNTIRATPGDTATITYVDRTLPDPFTTADEKLIEGKTRITGVGSSLPTAEIVFDKDTYTWTDLAKITVRSADHNLNLNAIDTIGGSDFNRIRIATRYRSVDHYRLVETGPDTGIFAGEVILTGFLHDTDGNSNTGGKNGVDTFPRTEPLSGGGPKDGLLEARHIDGLSISFQASESVAVVASVPIQWNTGNVEWLHPRYRPDGIGVVRVTDPDMNLNPRIIDRFVVDVWSDSDSGGIDLLLLETDIDSGIFEGRVSFTLFLESSGNRLRVADGDTVTTEYEDNTLPQPYTTADELDITAVAVIDSSIVPPTLPPPAPRPGQQTGSVRLDRLIYPVPFGTSDDSRVLPSFPCNDYSPCGRSFFPIHATGIRDVIDSFEEQLPRGDLTVHMEIHDPDFNRSSDSMDEIALNVGDDQVGPVKISIVRGLSNVVLGYAGGISKNQGRIDVDDNNPNTARQFGPIQETMPDSGIFAFDFTVSYTDGPASDLCPQTIRFDGLIDDGSEDELSRFDSSSATDENYCILRGDVLLVEYTDPTDNLARDNTGSQVAFFDLRDGTLRTDKEVYVIGRDIVLTLEDPDLNLDEFLVESYDIDLIEWDSDAATVTLGDADDELEAFIPRPLQLTEIEDQPGVFQTTIKMPEVLEGDRLERGEEIILEYTDWGPAGVDYVGQEDRDINARLFTSSFGATVMLNKKVYSWTDKVEITVVAPDHNFDPNGIDSIGETDLDPIKVSTRGHDLDNYRLIETDVDTGIFTGEVTLTGFLYDADGDSGTGDASGFDTLPRTEGEGPKDGLLESDSDDGITVSFEFSEDETVVGSALIRWTAGQVQWEDGEYSIGDVGIIEVFDPDMNVDPKSSNRFAIRVWSETDLLGTVIEVVETMPNSAIFTGHVELTTNAISGGQKLAVNAGDRIIAEYTDRTLPNSGTATESVKITDVAIIDPLSIPPAPLAVISFDKIAYNWIDSAVVTISSTEANLDPNTLDRIGKEGTGQLRIATQRGVLDEVSFEETAPNSGQFVGKVMLTGFLHDADGNQNTGDEKGHDSMPQSDSSLGKLENGSDDHLSVAFLLTENPVIAAVPITWHAGTVTWSQDEYRIDNTGIVEIVDPDMNLSLDKIDRFGISVWSDTDLSGGTVTVEETGPSTGVFRGDVIFTSDDISKEGQLRVEANDTITARYRDHTLPAPHSPNDRIPIIAITRIEDIIDPPPGSNTTITLDKTGYTWTDKVRITISSPAHNTNPNRIDEIGTFESSRLRITTRDRELDFYRLTETEKDTGIFTGEVTLTGFLHDADGDRDTGDDNGFDTNPRTEPATGGGPDDGLIEAEPEDAISVSFKISESESVVASAPVVWRTGTTEWSQATYPGSGTAVLQIIDRDMNLDPNQTDNFDVDVWSDSSARGIDLTVTETDIASGVFEGRVFLTTTDESSGHRLRVSVGDTMTAEYQDWTLPSPSRVGDVKSIIQTADIISRERNVSVQLDRKAYPIPFGSTATGSMGNEASFGRSLFPVHQTAISDDIIENPDEQLPKTDTVVHIRINDPRSNRSSTAVDTIRDIVPVSLAGPLKISVERGGRSVVLGYAGGLAENSGRIDVNDNNPSRARSFGPIMETEIDSGIFEFSLHIAYTDGPASFRCPATLHFDNLSGERGNDESTRFDSASGPDENYCILNGDLLVVEYADPFSSSGDVISRSTAEFRLHNGAVKVDRPAHFTRTVHIIDSTATVKLIDPDLNFDNNTLESYSLDLIEWSSKTATLTLGELGGEAGQFQPNPIVLTELNGQQGVFQSTIIIPRSLLGKNLSRGEEITLEYRDWGPANAQFVGQNFELAIHEMLTSNFGANIELGSKVFSWTERVPITVIAPDHNIDSNAIDDIGSTVSDPIRISTRGFDLRNYKLLETGLDTGIFKGEVTLTGFPFDADGDPNTGDSSGFDTNPQITGTGPDNGFIETSRDDGITVAFEFSEDETVIGSALIRWNIGDLVWFLQRINDVDIGLVRLIEPDMNLDPDAVDHIRIRVWSESDQTGLMLNAIETQEDSGTFEANVEFTTTNESSGNQLRAAPGDILSAEYIDYTLPDPFTLTGSFNVSAETLFRIAPLERFSVSDPRITDTLGNRLDFIKIGQEVLVLPEITNLLDQRQSLAFILQIKDAVGFVESLASISISMPPNGRFSPSLSWTPMKTGDYEATIFLWDSINSLSPVSPPQRLSISVGGTGQLVSEIVSLFSEAIPNTLEGSFDSGLTVTANRSVYFSGDVITLSGFMTGKFDPGIPLVMGIKSPSSTFVQLEQLEMGENGSFNTDFLAGGPLWEQEGTYTIIVRYGPFSREIPIDFFDLKADMGPTLTLRPSIFNFGDVPVGQTAQGRITLTNASATDLVVDEISISGQDASQFIVNISQCSLVPDQQRALLVDFIPDRIGPFRAALAVHSNIGLVQANLTGVGVSKDRTGQGVESLSLGKSAYANDEKVSFIGTEASGAQAVFVIIRSDDGKFMGMVSDPASNGDGKFVTIPRLVLELFTVPGTYTAIAFTQDQGENNGLALRLNYDGDRVTTFHNLSVSFDKLNYERGQSAMVSLTGPPSETVRLLVIDSSDTPVNSEILIEIGFDGRATHTLSLDGFSDDVYTAVVSMFSEQRNAVFTVGLETDSKFIRVNTTRLEYEPGDPLLILGQADPQVILSLILRDSEGNLMQVKETFSDKNGKFASADFHIPTNAKPGTWTVTARSGSSIATAEITIENTSNANGPEGVIAKAISSTQIQLSWFPPSNTFGQDIVGYVIEREIIKDILYEEIGTSETLTAFTANGLEPISTYTFVVSARLETGSTPRSNAASATTLPESTDSNELGIAPFVDPNIDPQIYVDRYFNEPAFQEWFDQNFPEYSSIYQAVGLPEPGHDDTNVLRISTDKTVYLPGDSISISGQIHCALLPSTDAQIDILTQGAIVHTATVTPEPGGRFTHSVVAAGSVWSAPGNYTIRVAYGFELVAETTFQLGPADTMFHAETDKDSYSRGEVVMLSGTGAIGNPLPIKAVTFILRDPTGNIIMIGQLHPNAGGSFSTTFIAEGLVWHNTGEYRLMVHFGDLSTTITFNFDSTPRSPEIVYVKYDAVGTADGTSWINAFTNLQDALAAATFGDEIWVAAGIYTPDVGGGSTPGDRSATFRLRNGVRIYGSFVGVEVELGQRTFTDNQTILSGDLFNNDDGSLDTFVDNCFHVVSGIALSRQTILDGFTISGGNADASVIEKFDSKGGGILINLGAPVIANCRIIDNSATAFGGGVAIINSGNPHFRSCEVIGNSTLGDGGGVGIFSASPTFVDCEFTGNSADGNGGGLNGHLYSLPNITNTTFVNNEAGGDGGALSAGTIGGSITNCTFFSNHAKSAGGGAKVFVELEDVVVEPPEAGSISDHHSGNTPFKRKPASISNSIFWHNTAAMDEQIAGTPDVSHSVIEGGFDGLGIVDQDPLFVDADGSDDIIGTVDDNLKLLSGSPAVDAGNNDVDIYPLTDGIQPLPGTDLAGNPRFADDPDTPDTGVGIPPIVDMGAYEYIPVPDLVGHWKMDEEMWNESDDEVIDSSALENHGTSQDGAQTVAEGKANRAGQFDGVDDGIDLGRIESGDPLQLTGGGTLVGWFNQEPDGDRLQRLVDKSTSHSGTNGYALIVDPLDRSVWLSVNKANYKSAAGVYAFNEWTHVAAVITENAFSIYINGVEIDGGFQTGGVRLPPEESASMSIGNWSHGLGRAFRGRLDDLRIYNQVLDGAAIQDITEEGSVASALIAHYRLDEGEGCTTADSAGVSAAKEGRLQPGCSSSDNDGPEWSIGDAKLGEALSFDGDDDYVELGEIAEDNPLQLSDGGTVAGWFKQDRGDRWQRIIDKSTNHSGANGYALIADPFDRSIWLGVNRANYKSVGGVYAFSEWTHVAAVFTENAFAIYINGVEVGGAFERGDARLPPVANASMRIGTWNHTTGREFYGLLDDLRIYGRALDAGEIAEIHEEASADSALVAHYDFGEGTGCTTADATDRTGSKLGSLEPNCMADGSDGPGWSVGKVTTGLELDGDDDYIELGSIEAGHPLQLSGGGTVAAWVRPQAGDRWQRIVDKSTNHSGTNGYALIADPFDRSIWLSVNRANYKSAAGVYELSEWAHVAAVITESVFTIFVDGVEVSGNFIAGSAQLPPDVVAGMRIGTWNHSSGREFHGGLDELRIYDRALAASEINDIIVGSVLRSPPEVGSLSSKATNDGPALIADNSSRFPILSQTVYEDGEDGRVDGWQAYGDGAVINLEDEIGNRIIATTGEFPVDSFRLGLKDGSDWNNTEEFTASFAVLMTDEVAVYFRIDSTDSEKYLCYRPGFEEIEIDDSVICFSLGIEPDGKWHETIRNLAEDLELAIPGTKLISIKDFYVFGSAKLDDIILIRHGIDQRH